MEPLKIKDLINYKISDSDVVKRVLAGEKELYEILMRRNNQLLFRVIRSYLNEEKEIEDLMQNTYLKAYEKLYQFKHHAKFSTWLVRIGINEALARLREKGRFSEVHSSSATQANLNLLEIADVPHSDPEKIFISRENTNMLEKAVDSLDLKYRAVYILREIEELSIAEISNCLKISKTNVKVRLHRAKSKIKENLYSSSSKEALFEFGFSKCDRLVEKVMKLV